MLNSIAETKHKMTSIRIKSFYIRGRLLRETSGEIYTKLGLKVKFKGRHLKVSSTKSAKIVSVNNHVYIHLYDASIVKLLITEGFVISSNKDSTALLELVDELGNKILATYMPKSTIRSIAVLTSGGDAPGMNGAIRAILRTAIKWGSTVYGVYNGYDGLIKDSIVELGWDSVGYHSSHGGTFLSSARSTKFMCKEGRKIATYNLAKRGIEGLFVLGGDGSIKGSTVLRDEWKKNIDELIDEQKLDTEKRDLKLKIVAIPSSIDNDISNTDITLGADTAINRAVDSITSLSTTMASHHRSFVIEVMGKNCGWIALMVGLAVSSDFVFLPESPHSDWRKSMIKSISTARDKGKIGSFIIVSEGAMDISGNLIKTNEIRKEIENELHMECRILQLGHIQRGGRPSAYDKILSTIWGCRAVEQMLGDENDDPLMMRLLDGKYSSVCLLKVLADNEKIAELQKKSKYEEVLRMRGIMFNRALVISNQLRKPLLQIQKNKVIGILHDGCRRGGMNVALYAIVKYVNSLNQEVKVIFDGFAGLLQDKVKKANMYDYANGIHSSGSMIGSSNLGPVKKVDKIYQKLVKHGIDALIIIGGSDAVKTTRKLSKYISKSEKIIDIVLIPATIHNEVPYTDMALGVDTTLNCITIGCEFLRLSSLAMKRTCFIAEIPGDKGGYLTVFGGIAAGAFDIFVPERKYKISHLSETAERLKYRFKNGNRHGIILLKNQKSFNSVSADAFSRIISTDSDDLYDAKFMAFGYFVEGGSPSPYDRIGATIFGIKAVDIILGIDSEKISNMNTDKSFAGMLGTQGQILLFTDINTVYKTSQKIRKGKLKPRWSKYVSLCRSME